LYEITLSDTILFAEGGGQPSDTGVIDGQEVLYVYRDVEVYLLIIYKPALCICLVLSLCVVCRVLVVPCLYPAVFLCFLGYVCVCVHVCVCLCVCVCMEYGK